MLEDYQLSDLDSLTELYESEDPRSIAEMIADDPYEEIVVEKAKKYKDDLWDVTFEGADLSFEYLRDFAIPQLVQAGHEGIVWHHHDGRMAKLKVRDFS